MTRYFYRDPLAAAWMAKHFGMRFDNLKEVIEGVDGDTTLLAMPRFVNDCRKARRFIIHPDSVHLLEANGSTDLTLNGISSAVDAKPLPKGENRIILRNGIPFMWPESGAA